MGQALVKIVGECPFCSKGNEDERNVKKSLREGKSGYKSEYKCGIGKSCIVVKLYKFVDESLGFKDRESFY